MRLIPSSIRARLVVVPVVAAVTLWCGVDGALAQSTRPAAHATTTEPTSQQGPESVATTGQSSSDAARRSWPEAVHALAVAVSAQDMAATSRTLDASTLIRSFASETLKTPERLVAAGAGAKILGAHAYLSVPKALASDLADDFRGAGDAVPEATRVAMTPPDETAAGKANETAGSWVASVLKLDSREHPVGVIVLWPQERASRVDGPPRRAIFVLVRGQRVDEHFVIKQVVFGDPLETPRS